MKACKVLGDLLAQGPQQTDVLLGGSSGGQHGHRHQLPGNSLPAATLWMNSALPKCKPRPAALVTIRLCLPTISRACFTAPELPTPTCHGITRSLPILICQVEQGHRIIANMNPSPIMGVGRDHRSSASPSPLLRQGTTAARPGAQCHGRVGSSA